MRVLGRSIDQRQLCQSGSACGLDRVVHDAGVLLNAEEQINVMSSAYSLSHTPRTGIYKNGPLQS